MMLLNNEAFKIQTICMVPELCLPISRTSSERSFLQMDPEIMELEPKMDNCGNFTENVYSPHICYFTCIENLTALIRCTLAIPYILKIILNIDPVTKDYGVMKFELF